MGNPEVEHLNENQLLLSFKELNAVYNKDQGGWIGRTEFKKSKVFLSCQDNFPSKDSSYRKSPTRIVHDSESVFARTFHENPKLSVNRSFILKDDTLELNWKMKNSDKESIKGIFELKIGLASAGELKTAGTSTILNLNNGTQIEIKNDKALKFTLKNQLLIIQDPAPRTIKALHRSSQKVTFKFSN